MSMHSALPFRDSKGLLWERGKRPRPSEGELATRFAEQHCREVRYLAGRERVRSFPARKPQWIAWNGTEWLIDSQNRALHLAREICKEAAEAYGDPAIDSHRSVAGVLALAKCDPRLVAEDWPCDPFIEAAVSEWLADHCVLSPHAWTPRADLLATFVNWQDFDREDLTAALEVRGVSYVRRGNIHGFCGIRLKDGDDVDA